MSKLGQVVRRLREEKQMSQIELASASGNSRNGISLIERGTAINPTIGTLQGLAYALGTDVVTLLDAAVDPTPETGIPGGILVGTFDAREIRLMRNCINYAKFDPAGLPGHNLAIIIAKLCQFFEFDPFDLDD